MSTAEKQIKGSTKLAQAALEQSALFEGLDAKIENRRKTRYVFFPYADALCSGVAGGVIPRGRIQPITPFIKTDRATDVPKEAPTIKRDKLNATYVIDNVQAIAGAAVSQYENRGGIEIPGLMGMPVEKFDLEIKLNELVFGSEVDELTGELKVCETAAEYFARFAEVEASLDGLTPESRQAIKKLLLLLRQSVSRAVEYAKRIVSETHADMDKAANGNDDHLGYYDARAHKALRFAGITPRTEATEQIAANQNSLQEALPQLIERLIQNQEAAKPDYAALGQGIAEGLIKAGLLVPTPTATLQNSKTAKPKVGKTETEEA